MARFDREALFLQRAEELSTGNLRRGLQMQQLPSHALLEQEEARYAFRLDQLLGVSHQAITPVPLAGPSLLGVTAYLGEIWPVYWLRPPAPGRPSVQEGLVLFARGRRLSYLAPEGMTLASLREPEERLDRGFAPGLRLTGQDDDAIQFLEVVP